MRDMPCCVGIDVAKAQLDIAMRPSGERWAVPHDASGVATLVDQLQVRQPILIGLEATGGLERGDQRRGHGGSAGGRRDPASGAGCCPGHGPAGHNGCVRCARWPTLPT